ncbi:MAG: 1,4-alpha-glucan branching protein GlgB [Verrucomicrobiota bacterium]
MTTTPTPPEISFDLSLFGEIDTHLFREGNHFRLYEKCGAQVVDDGERKGVYFCVWAPNANRVEVVGDFNHWDGSRHQLGARWDGSGLWEGFVPGLVPGTTYKYRIHSNHFGQVLEKADPFAFQSEVPPKSASVISNLDYDWGDGDWMANRHERNALNAAWSVYEVHLGSWRHRVNEDGSHESLSYRELAPQLAEYVKDLGYTHVEFLPVMEHPFYGSWGYQITGYFAPTSRFGTPQDFMYLIDYLHQEGIGVILDWVPSHFASDGHGLSRFDGTALFEHEDRRKGYHPDWGSYIFNYGRNEVRSFLISNACYWLDKFHVDGLRIDAVASMLYLDYSRKEGEWIPNEHGGKENLEAISFLRRMNEVVYEQFPDVQTIAEESTSFPMVSKPLYVGGLGFGFKWNMGWMHDTLYFISREPIFRKYHHHSLTFSMLYAFTENFMLPFSHDEVVHGKGSMIGKVPGDDWQKFANLRLLYGYMFAHPGQKLMFMGGEFGQWREWNHDASLDWHLIGWNHHGALRNWVRDLNNRFRTEKALHDNNFSPEGFYWVDFKDWEQSIVSFVRRSADGRESILCVLNFTPVPRDNYRVGVPEGGFWEEILNSDAADFGGSGLGNYGGLEAVPFACHEQPASICVTVPPLSMVAFKKVHAG